MIYLVCGADRLVEFRRMQDNSDSFRVVNGAAGVMEMSVNANAPDLIEYTDPFGTVDVG